MERFRRADYSEVPDATPSRNLPFQNGFRAQGRRGNRTPEGHLYPKAGPIPLSGNDGIGGEEFGLKYVVSVGLKCRPEAARVLSAKMVSSPHRQGERPSIEELSEVTRWSIRYPETG